MVKFYPDSNKKVPVTKLFMILGREKMNKSRVKLLHFCPHLFNTQEKILFYLLQAQTKKDNPT